jgi:drug/metabolite transporter (DMT)-like permease
MRAEVLALLLLAACMHASWNALVHRGSDRLSTLIILCGVQGTLSVCVLPLLAWPPLAAVPWLLFGTVLRVLYSIVLVYAYGIASFSRVYPIARGAAPLLAAVLAALTLGEWLPARGLLALGAIVVGISMIARIDIRPMPNAHALRAGLLAAALTASYSLVDARGVRLSPDAFGYAAFGFVGESVGIVLYATLTRGFGALKQAGLAWRGGVPAGFCAGFSYLVALWAFRNSPVALVGVVRETSVLFALLIAAFILREPLMRRDWVAGSLIVIGAAAARF